MQLKRKTIPALLLVLFMGFADAGAAEQAYTYGYQLTVDAASSTNTQTVFHLFAASTGIDAPVLHAGSVALGTKRAATVDDLIFSLDAAWEFLPHQYLPGVMAPGALEEVESGITVIEAMPYLSFGWGVPETKEPPQGNPQYIGSLTVKRGGLSVDDVVLVPYPETVSGAALIAVWKNAADPLPYLNMIESVWRMVDDDRPANGFYQGYFVSERPKDEIGLPSDAVNSPNGKLFATDITNGWQSFRIQSFNPFKAVTIELRKTGDSALTQSFSVSDTGTLPGRTTVIPTWDGLTLVDGQYDMTVKKRSHVSVTYKNLTVKGDVLFPELQGLLCYLPCGDMNGDEQIKLWDRALLTKATVYGKPAATVDVSDLDGDGRVGQRDLAILIDPAHYGKAATTMIFDGTKGDTT